MDRNLVLYNLFFIAQVVLHGRRERDFFVFADKTTIDVSIMGEEQRIAAFPGDCKGFPAQLYRVGEGKVIIKVVDYVAKGHAIDSSIERSDIDNFIGLNCASQKCASKEYFGPSQTIFHKNSKFILLIYFLL